MISRNRHTLTAGAWSLVVLYATLNYAGIKLMGHSELSTLHAYFLQTKLEGLKLEKNPKQPLPLGWVRKGSEIYKPNASNEVLCGLIEKEQETLLKCSEQNDLYITTN